MKFTRNLPTQTRRDAWVEVNLGRLEQNAREIRQAIGPDKTLMAIVKADAYGHGSVMTLPTLQASGVAMAGVASMDEAIQIRKAGLEIPLLVIGSIPDWAVQVAAEFDIQLTVFAKHHLDSLKAAYQLTQKPVKVHIKVDTGMHRIGIAADEAVAFIKDCQQLSFIQVEGIFTHLAWAENPEICQIQWAVWQNILAQLPQKPRWIHSANSAGALCYPSSPLDNMVRVGMAFYGYPPRVTQELGERLPPLLPVMGLKARIVHLQEIPPESGVSYNHLYQTPVGSPRVIATLPLGYADGIPRGLSNHMKGLLRGVEVPQVGAITMDQLMLDVTGIPGIAEGETVTLLGTEKIGEAYKSITLRDWADYLRTIEYELMCGLRVRLPKVYTRD